MGLIYFETPYFLVYSLISKAGIHSINPAKVLEPSAGRGRIISVLKEFNRNLSITAVENDPDNCNYLREKYPGLDLYQIDFLKINFSGYNYVIMNPPFENNLWQKHIHHAQTFLKEGGTLVSVIPRGGSEKFPEGKSFENPAHTFVYKEQVLLTDILILRKE